MTKAYIGIDPGIGGAIAVLIDGEFGEVIDMPIDRKKTGRNEVDTAGLLEVLSDFTGRARLSFVMVERVAAMPRQGVSSQFSLGDSFGCARTAATSCAHRVAYIPAGTWKRTMGLSGDKLYSLTIARRTFPSARSFLLRRRDEGRAEAIMLAKYACSVHQW